MELTIAELIKVIILGIVEGVTEWLPISSTGHMILVDSLMTLQVSPKFKDMFLVVIQLGAILAVRLGAGFVPARKPGKLPAEKVTEVYFKEYGTDSVEIHTGAISSDDVVLVHDDLLATGGSIGAAFRLVSKFNPAKVYMNCIIDLTDCPRRDVFPTDVPFTSIIAIKEHE